MTDIGKIHYLPERVQGLADLALNLWWRSDSRARALMKRIDPVVWAATRHNPILLLRTAEPARLAELTHDEDFLAQFDAVMADFERATNGHETWFHSEFPDVGKDSPVAYFCAEFGLHNSIPIYSGGLGVLAGDHCKAATDLGVPFIGVGLLYAKGYFDQKINLDGWQEKQDESFDHRNMPLVRLAGPDGSYRLAELETAGRMVGIGAWQLDVGGVRLYLLDTDLPENAPEDRGLTYTLYGEGVEYRLKQEWILGVGGVRVLRALGIEPGAWHANEGHAAFMLVERLREQIAAGGGWDDSIAAVRARSIFTTHTPVAAGHDTFSRHQVMHVCDGYHEGLGIDEDTFMGLGRNPADDNGHFHMTAAAIRLSAHVNGVSRRHGQVSREIWKDMWPGRAVERVPIGYVTNGVHLDSWMSSSLVELLEGVFGTDWQRDPPVGDEWDAVMDVPDEAIWDTHYSRKKVLLTFAREQARVRWKTEWREAAHLVGAGTLLRPEPFTIGFARRFASYKRGALLFRDEERLRELLTDLHHPVQLVFAGKAHPADDNGKRILQRVWQASRDPKFEGRIAFVEDYDLHVAHHLVQGVDLWLNLPRVPKEASGTSGMKAALNGVPQLSTVDGWWAEAFNGDNGWAIPLTEGTPEEVDAHDYRALIELLEREVVPEYYSRDEDDLPREWIRKMKQSIVVAGKVFTTGRMVQEYTTKYYLDAMAGRLDEDDRPVFDPPRFLEGIGAD
jgi:starch phosphorylase